MQAIGFGWIRRRAIVDRSSLQVVTHINALQASIGLGDPVEEGRVSNLERGSGSAEGKKLLPGYGMGTYACQGTTHQRTWNPSGRARRSRWSNPSHPLLSID